MHDLHGLGLSDSDILLQDLSGILSLSVSGKLLTILAARRWRKGPLEVSKVWNGDMYLDVSTSCNGWADREAMKDAAGCWDFERSLLVRRP